MTRVQGDLKIITGTAEAVTEVWVRSKTARPVSGGWLMTTNDRKPVFDGKVDLELLPGACVLVAVSSGLPGETVELIVPESGTASLEACIRAAEAAGELERDALDELRRDFGAWIDEARASVSAAGESATAADESARAAKSEAGKAAGSAKAAAGSASEAKTSADSAGKSATAADGSATAADKSRSDASAFANSAKTASESATASARQAAGSASAANTAESQATISAANASGFAASAKNDADRAKSSADSASTSASGAKGSADAAKRSADAAGKSATAAAGSASAAKTDAGKAATSATNASKSATSAKADADRAVGVVDSVQWNDDKLTVAGKTSPSLRGEKGDPGGVRGFAIEGKGTDPQATGTNSLALGWGANAKGRRSSAMGYGAQAESDFSISIGDSAKAGGKQSVAAGDGAKAEGGRSTAVGAGARVAVEHEVSSAIGAYAATTAPNQTRIGNTDSSYHVSLAGDVRLTQEPSRDDNAATKKYVDGAVRDKADKSYVDSKDAEARALVGSRPAFFSGSGAPPSSIPGAVVGDYYLDETTMELHKITGV